MHLNNYEYIYIKTRNKLLLNEFVDQELEYKDDSIRTSWNKGGSSEQKKKPDSCWHHNFPPGNFVTCETTTVSFIPIP